MSDHKPLESILRKELSDIVNPRLQRLREKINAYNYNVCYVAGKDNLVANALSRSPLEGTFRDEEETGAFDITRQTIDYQFKMTRKDPLFAKLFRAA